MDIKKIRDNAINFGVKRLAEAIGIILIVISFLLLISLLSYSPEDPNFIFPENAEIKNLLGIRGSFTSDFFYQSVGLISILIPFSIFFTGLNILKRKDFLIIIENLFFIILYLLLGSLFFSVFHTETFWLNINGNNGFVGNFFDNGFLVNFIGINKNISYYFIIFLILLCFLISINFNLKFFIKNFKLIFNFFTKKQKNINNFNNEPLIDKVSEIKKQETRIQENFSFENNVKNSDKKTFIFKLPTLEFLKKPSKKERDNSSENRVDGSTLEKILLDFGVEGQIKKISHGPVVTLHEFEPAPGVKVSKIINLSEDIARNTSSDSARISTVQGSSTIGIELPKSSRENVYLSEVISSTKFLKKNIKLPIALGKSISGDPIIGDLSSMPHLLIAGTT